MKMKKTITRILNRRVVFSSPWMQLIEKNIENLRLLHEKRGQKGLTKDLTEPVRAIINIQFKAMLTLEFAKKRGK